MTKFRLLMTTTILFSIACYFGAGAMNKDRQERQIVRSIVAAVKAKQSYAEILKKISPAKKKAILEEVKKGLAGNPAAIAKIDAELAKLAGAPVQKPPVIQPPVIQPPVQKPVEKTEAELKAEIAVLRDKAEADQNVAIKGLEAEIKGKVDDQSIALNNGIAALEDAIIGAHTLDQLKEDLKAAEGLNVLVGNLKAAIEAAKKAKKPEPEKPAPAVGGDLNPLKAEIDAKAKELDDSFGWEAGNDEGNKNTLGAFFAVQVAGLDKAGQAAIELYISEKSKGK